LLIFFIARAIRFSGKVESIKGGMTYKEVVEILGEPKSSTTAQGIRTCMWSRVVIRGLFNNHIITFKDDKVISVDGNSNFWVS